MKEAERAKGGGDHHQDEEASEDGVEESPTAVPEFIKACGQVMDRLSIGQVERWFEKGVELLRQNPDGGLAYFKIESVQSESTLESLSSGNEFGPIKTLP